MTAFLKVLTTRHLQNPFRIIFYNAIQKRKESVVADITLNGETIHTYGNLPEVGARGPNFTLVDTELKDHHLSHYQDKFKVLYIVPSLDTSVCLHSTKILNDEAKKHPEAVFLIISNDSPFAMKRICGLEKLENVIPLSILRNKDFARDYGLLIQDGPMEGLCARALIILGPDNQVIYSELVSEITHEPNYQAAMEAF